MDEQKIHIDNLYRDKHGDFAGAPPSNVWDALEDRLDSTPKDNGFSFRWIWYVLIIVAALFLAYYIGKGFRKKNVQEPAKEQRAGLISAGQNPATDPNYRSETTITVQTTDSGSSAFATADQATNASDQTTDTRPAESDGSITGIPHKELQRGHDRNWHANRARNKQDSDKGNLVSRQTGSARARNSGSQPGDHTTSGDQARTVSNDSVMQSPSQINVPGISQGEKQQTTPIKQPEQNQSGKTATIANSNGVQSKGADAPKKQRDTTGHFAANQSGDVSKQTTASSKATHTTTKPGSAGASVPPADNKAKEVRSLTVKNQPGIVAATTPPIASGHDNNGQQPQVDANPAAASKKGKAGIALDPAPAKPAFEAVTNAEQKSPEMTSESGPTDAVKATTTKSARKKAKKEKLTAKGKGDSNIQADNSTRLASTEPAPGSPAKADSPSLSDKDGSAAQDPMVKRKTPFSSWEFGLKAGYEFGLQTVKVNKLIAGPYAAYNISPRFSVAVQPSIKSGRLQNQVLSKEQAYVNTNGITTDTILIFMGGFVQRAYVFKQSYDSMVASYKMGGSLLEAEIPVTLRYTLSKHFTLSGGFTLSFGKILQVTETKDVYQGIVLVDTFISNSPSQPLPDTSDIFIHTSPPFSAFNNSAYQNPQSNPMRLGFIAGICYDHKRFLVELTLQQNISRLSNVPNADIKAVYKQPYIRILAGYRLW